MLPKTLEYFCHLYRIFPKNKKSGLVYQVNQTAIETIFLEAGPSSTMTMLGSIIRKEFTLDIPLSKEENKINQIAYIKPKKVT